jgi:hypothetical protein
MVLTFTQTSTAQGEFDLLGFLPENIGGGAYGLTDNIRFSQTLLPTGSGGGGGVHNGTTAYHASNGGRGGGGGGGGAATSLFSQSGAGGNGLVIVQGIV